MGCPNLETLADFARGLLAETERATVNTHLAAGCPQCQENQAWLSEVALLAAQDKSFAYPEWIIKRVVAQFEAQSVTPLAQIKQFFAELIFDSLHPNQLAEVRSETAGMGQALGRQTLYQVEGYDIDLRFEQTEDTHWEELIGQILPKQASGLELAGITIQLLQNGVALAQTNANTRGIFKFAPIAAGHYDVKITVPEGEINIQQMTTARFS